MVAGYSIPHVVFGCFVNPWPVTLIWAANLAVCAAVCFMSFRELHPKVQRPGLAGANRKRGLHERRE